MTNEIPNDVNCFLPTRKIFRGSQQPTAAHASCILDSPPAVLFADLTYQTFRFVITKPSRHRPPWPNATSHETTLVSARCGYRGHRGNARRCFALAVALLAVPIPPLTCLNRIRLVLLHRVHRLNAGHVRLPARLLRHPKECRRLSTNRSFPRSYRMASARRRNARSVAGRADFWRSVAASFVSPASRSPPAWCSSTASTPSTASPSTIGSRWPWRACSWRPRRRKVRRS